MILQPPPLRDAIVDGNAISKKSGYGVEGIVTHPWETWFGLLRAHINGIVGFEGSASTLAPVANTAAETTAIDISIPGGEWGDGDIIEVTWAALVKNNKGSPGIITMKVNFGDGAQVTLGTVGSLATDSAAELKTPGQFWLWRVGSDVWVLSGGSFTLARFTYDLDFTAYSAQGVRGVSTPTNFSATRSIQLKITLAAAHATFYYNVQKAKVIHYRT